MAKTTVDAFRHVNVVAGGASGAVFALLGFDGDGLGGADCFAEFAGDAAFFAGWVAAEGVLAAEAGGDGAFFEGVVDCVAYLSVSILPSLAVYDMLGGGGDLRRPKELLKHDVHPSQHLGEEEVVARLVPDAVLSCVPALGFGHAEVRRWWAFEGILSCTG